MSHKRDCGLRRYQRRNFIKAAIISSGMTQAVLADLVGVSQQAVSATVNGYIHSERVLNKLREIGVPEKFLFDPRKDSNAA